jgi:2-dehydropantoate 2-reductase
MGQLVIDEDKCVAMLAGCRCALEHGMAGSGRQRMRMLVIGAGVIGSVYGGRFAQSGHDVTLLARGRRLADLQAHGLLLEDASSGQRTQISLPVVSRVSQSDDYDLVLVPVRSEQLASTLPILLDMSDRPDVLFFGNTVGQQTELVAALGERALFGFPAVGGVRRGPVVRYMQIAQQKTMLGEAGNASSGRVRRLRAVFGNAGFPANVTANISGWVLGHTAFVVPIGFALYRCDCDPNALAADHGTLTLMVRATREAFKALDNVEIPANLRWLYLRMPTAFAVRYWRGVFASPRGELWFGAHSRAAPDEMHALARELRLALQLTGRLTPSLSGLVPAL